MSKRKVILWYLAAFLLGFLVGGCRTIKGAADGFMLDGQSMFNYAVENKNRSTESQ